MHNYNVDHKYKFQTRIGNWFEEWELDETKKKDYLKNRQNGQLASIVKDQKTNFSLRLASLTYPKDEYIHFGFHIMLQNLKTQGFLSIDIQEKIKITEEAYNVTTGPTTQPTVRSVFVVVPYILNEIKMICQYIYIIIISIIIIIISIIIITFQFVMQEKIDQEVIPTLSANFLPEYPVNGWLIFKGLFMLPQMICVNLRHQLFLNLEEEEESKTCFVHSRGIILGLVYLLGHLSNFHLGLSFWGKLGIWKHNQKQKEQIQYTNRKKRQSQPFKDAPGVKPKLETKAKQRAANLLKTLQPYQIRNNNKGIRKDKSNDSKKTSPYMWSMFKQQQNIRSYRTHMHQAHNKQVPEGSSHTIQGKSQARAVSIKVHPFTQSDQFKQPRQDKKNTVIRIKFDRF